MREKCNGEEMLGRMLELLKGPGDVRKTVFVERASRRLGLSRHATRALLNEAIARGLVSASRRYSAISADRSSLFLERTGVPFVSSTTSDAMSAARIPEVWMNIPGTILPYQVSNRGRLRKLVPIAGDGSEIGFELVGLKCERGTGRFGWKIRCGYVTGFLYRDDMLKRFGDIPCSTDPDEERIVIEKTL